MPRFLVSTKRALRSTAPSAAEAVRSSPGITVVDERDPHMITIEAEEDAAAKLREELEDTHYVEPVTKRKLH